MAEVNLLKIDRGLIVAPAGCGKTHLITDALRDHDGDKPILVLTHTNAGVAALRHRLKDLDIPRSSYRLATIDGWGLRLASLFPQRAEYSAGPNPTRPNYKCIRKAAWTILKNNHITDVLVANYSRLLVDEYQDCSINQHGIVYYAATKLPACVLGDPMQAIFGFGDDRLADWDEHVCKHFPPAGELDKPWRWTNAGNETLGHWLLETRQALISGDPVNLGDAPESVHWVELKGDAGDHKRLVNAARCAHKSSNDTTLVIGDSRSASSRYRVARNVPGIVTVEPVDLSDMTRFARELDLASDDLVRDTLDFAQSVITNVGTQEVMKRLLTLEGGRERRSASELEQAALNLRSNPSLKGVAALLSECTRQTGCRTFRPGVLRSCLRALAMSAGSSSTSFAEAAVLVREENRAVGRQLPRSAIGSTLLLKGLEADHVVVLNAGELDARNLYVSLTRGAKSITVCSRSRILNPQ